MMMLEVVVMMETLGSEARGFQISCVILSKPQTSLSLSFLLPSVSCLPFQTSLLLHFAFYKHSVAIRTQSSMYPDKT